MQRRKATVELFEQIRREYEFGVGTIQGVARKFQVHRRLVREALERAVPAEGLPGPRPRPRVEAVAGFIEAILEADRKAPRKQRHTAHRIYTRITQELPQAVIAESTVRHYVRERKAALGLLSGETYVPQSYPWGQEAQVDWYEAVAELDGERATLYVFVLRSMASGGAFHRAYRRMTQQAFLEAHEYAFAYFGGVFRRLRYDNLPEAVKRIVRGFRRENSASLHPARFVAFRSHWRFEAEFCAPGEAHEKGGVESEVGRFRRNHWVPVPAAPDLAALNVQLLAGCQADETRHVDGETQTVGAALLVEREHLLPLATEPFDLIEVSCPTVNSVGCVKVKTNAYSAPVKAGTRVEVKLSAASVAIWYAGRCVAEHERSYGRHQNSLRSPPQSGALLGGAGAQTGGARRQQTHPLAGTRQWRQTGRWPASYDQFWQGLIERQGRSAGTKAMIELLLLGQRHGQPALRTAIEAALALGCHDSAAVRHLLTARDLERPPSPALEVGDLVQFERPVPTVDEYDRLLVATQPAGSVAR